MLKSIDPILTPDLLHALASMGHGDTIAIVDANYPAARSRRLIEMPGVEAPRALAAVLTLLPIDTFVATPCMTMQVVGDPSKRPAIIELFDQLLSQHDCAPAQSIDRDSFYQQAATAYGIIRTGELRLYGNIILTKGVIQSSIE